MNHPKTISQGTNHKALDLGKFDQLIQYGYDHPVRKMIIQGKIFTGELIGASGTELSFQIVPPHTNLPFMHAHNKHEEIYVIIRGSGQFQVDDKAFDISEGTVIRVNPNGSRTYRNNSDDPMIFMCIQTMAGSLDCYFGKDGYKSEGVIAW